MNSSQALPLERPTGFPEPANSALSEAKILIESQKFTEAILRLNELQPVEKLEILWKSYLLGLAYIGNEDLEKGVPSFLACHEAVKSDSSATAEEFRVAGMCLKKIGWYHRNSKAYIKAFAYHSFRYSYVIDHGSNLEVHDALISLDVDAYFLKDAHLSERLLRESISYGENIVDEKFRYMALGTSYNNLGGTLVSLKKFEGADKAIQSALEFWQKYESLAGVKELKVVWAYYGVGDVYEQWSIHLKENQENYAEKKGLALLAYKRGLELAGERGASSSDLQAIGERIKAVEAM